MLNCAYLIQQEASAVNRLTLKHWDWSVSSVFLAGAIIFGVSAYRDDILAPLSALGLVLCTGSIILGRVKLRCPFCHHFLGFISASSYPFCPWCGDQLTGSGTDKG